MKYFAYGSNLCREWLQSRTPSAVFLGSGLLRSYVLRFHKKSLVDTSAKCNAYFTGDPADRVWGGLYLIDPAEEDSLDKAEDLGTSYRKKIVSIEQSQAEKGIRATIYVALPGVIEEGLYPFEWYKRLVLQGAKSLDLPRGYVDAIQAVESIKDPDNERRDHNLRFRC